ncbi:MAG: hypothetical protein H0T46_14605 [Deltaproteobacteria bacterium]|nr:hypothetical protein [Deltaproteobacteria bacterium]
MRPSLLLLVALAGCGKSSDAPAAGAKRVAAEEDPPCDPKTPKVCVGQDVVACEPHGRLGRALRACKNGCARGKCKGSCNDEATKLIYLVDSANNFLSFDPRLLPGDPFHLIGKLTCQGRMGSPFSMSVDRTGTAWVLYEDGELFKVDIADAHCEPSGYVAGSSGSTNFGMGFATDAPGAETEKLYIASDDATNALHAIDTSKDLTPKRMGAIQAANSPNPELTGGSDAKLYGFYPQSSGVAFVQQIERTSGKEVGPRWPLGTEPLGDVNAYAFAQWAGVFYIFVTTFDDVTFDHNSTVRTLDPQTGRFDTVVTRSPFRITGAGVSTCAPERDAKPP